MRMNERNRLITKVGITLRDLLLDDYRSLISKVIYDINIDAYGVLSA